MSIQELLFNSQGKHVMRQYSEDQERRKVLLQSCTLYKNQKIPFLSPKLDTSTQVRALYPEKIVSSSKKIRRLIRILRIVNFRGFYKHLIALHEVSHVLGLSITFLTNLETLSYDISRDRHDV